MTPLNRAWLCALAILPSVAVHAGAPAPFEHPGSIHFHGTQTAELFSKEIAESLKGVIAHNVMTSDASGFPRGFVRASLPGEGWSETCWTRDTGGLLRELALWGHLDTAVLVAEFLRTHVTLNPEGYYTFPEHFDAGAARSGWGKEMDGTSAIVIGMVRLWQRLPAGHEMRAKLQRFLTSADSPVAYMARKLDESPLIAGSGEFGGGWDVPGEWFNVVANNLVRQALLAGAELEEEGGTPARARILRAAAGKLGASILKHLVNSRDGSWVWCVDPQTMAADDAVLNHRFVRGTASINGASSSYADAEGLEPAGARWPGVKPARTTLHHVYNAYPVRKEQFRKYGMCTLADYDQSYPTAGYASWLSYGDCFAAQTMLLLDETAALDRVMTWIAAATYMNGSPTGDFIQALAADRAAVDLGLEASTYWFTERNYSPDFTTGREPGCGKLNLVNVVEPLKLARLMLGVDDRYADVVTLLPRLPSSWKGLDARNWLVKTKDGLVRLDLQVRQRAGGSMALRLVVLEGGTIPHLIVRLSNGTRREYRSVAGTLEIE